MEANRPEKCHFRFDVLEKIPGCDNRHGNEAICVPTLGKINFAIQKAFILMFALIILFERFNMKKRHQFPARFPLQHSLLLISIFVFSFHIICQHFT